MNLRFILLAILQKRLAEEIISVWIARLDRERLFIMHYGFAEASLPVQPDREIVMRQRAVRLMPHNGSIMLNSFPDKSRLQQNVTKICLRLRILRQQL